MDNDPMVEWRDSDIAAGRLQQEIAARIPKGTWQGDWDQEWTKASLALLAEARADADAWRCDAIELRRRLGLSTCDTAPGCQDCPDCNPKPCLYHPV